MNWKHGYEMEEESRISFGLPEEQLKNVNEAIYKILAGGQSYRIGTRSLTRADLATLIAERNKLEAQLQGSSTTLLAGAYAADFGPDNRR